MLGAVQDFIEEFHVLVCFVYSIECTIQCMIKYVQYRVLCLNCIRLLCLQYNIMYDTVQDVLCIVHLIQYEYNTCFARIFNNFLSDWYLLKTIRFINEYYINKYKKNRRDVNF